MITDFSCKKTNKKKMAGYTCPFKRKKKKVVEDILPFFPLHHFICLHRKWLPL